MEPVFNLHYVADPDSDEPGVLTQAGEDAGFTMGDVVAAIERRRAEAQSRAFARRDPNDDY